MKYEIQNLSTGYRLRGGDKVIAARLSATLSQGRLTCLLGPNGSGKSTLLRTMSGLQPALEGEIMADGVKLSSLDIRERAKFVSVVLTSVHSVCTMSVNELVAMGRSPYTGFWGRLTQRDREIVDESLRLVGMEQFARRRIQTLSDGERQKVLIAKAIAQETPYIFLDEPTAFLDYPSKVKMMLLLHRLSHSYGKTILLSTHDVEHALSLADTIWLLDREHGLVTGTPHSLGEQGLIGQYFDSDEVAYDAREQRFKIFQNRHLP